MPISTFNICEIPSDINTNKQIIYSEECLTQANNLLNLSKITNKPLYILWSGGIDSTVMLISFLIINPKMENCVILLSKESINEYTYFFNNYIRGKYKIETSYDFFNLFDGTKILVTGELNDQLFGNDLIRLSANILGEDVIKSKYYSGFLKSTFSDISNISKWSNLLDELALKCPSGIETISEFFWWFNFSCKWQSVYTRSLAYINKKHRKNITEEFLKVNYQCFFNTSNFQNWSVWNKDKKFGLDWKSYKLESKKFIFDFSKDENYFQNKIKKVVYIIFYYSSLQLNQ